MKYPSDSNRVYRIDEGGECFHYIAPDDTAAAALHGTMNPDRNTQSTVLVYEVPPEKTVRVIFDNYADAIATMLGLRDDVRQMIRSAFWFPKGFGSTVLIGQAAEYWARTVTFGETKQLSSSAL